MKQILPALLVLVFIHASVQAADKIRITVSGLSGQFMTFPLAQKRGFLKEEGLDAEIIRITGAASRAALSSGEVDYSTGLGSNIGLAMTGLPIKVVACYVPAPVLALVARAEVKTVQALRGKTVGILVFGGVAHFAARTIAIGTGRVSSVMSTIHMNAGGVGARLPASSSVTTITSRFMSFHGIGSVVWIGEG